MDSEIGEQGRGRPRDPRIDLAIRSAALAVLEQSGYSQLTLEAVATQAGTNKPALRRRWRSKQHLVVDALLSRLGSAPTPDTGCTRCDLIQGINTLSQGFNDGNLGKVLPALVADLDNDPALREEFFTKLFHPRRETSARALRRGIDRGEIRPDADIELVLDLLGAPAYYRALFGHLPLHDGLAEEVVTAVLSGVATEQWRGHHEQWSPKQKD